LNIDLFLLLVGETRCPVVFGVVFATGVPQLRIFAFAQGTASKTGSADSRTHLLQPQQFAISHELQQFNVKQVAMMSFFCCNCT
jgi:hypothetical protein